MFNNMNHLKIYERLIKVAKSENRKRLNKKENNYIYYENHHILPKCMGGLDTEDNLVLLTAKEHYVCHKLLVYIYPKQLNLIFAFRMMSKNSLYNISSRDYEYAKKLYNALPTSEKTKEKRFDAWFEINCSEKSVNNYLDSLKKVRCGANDLLTIHIPFKR